mgnify:FL=1
MDAWRIVMLFLVFGLLWILGSDHALNLLTHRPDLWTTLQSVKGMAFVAFSAALIYVLVARAARQQKRLQAEVENQRDRFASILSVSPAAVYSLKPRTPGGTDFEVDYVSDKMEQITGFGLQAWRADAQFWLQRIHPDDRARVAASQADLLAKGNLSNEYRFQHAQGSYRWIRDTVILLRDAEGRPTQVTGTWLDITDRKQIELNLSESELRYRELYESNPMPMFIYDQQTLRFLSVNKAAESAYGYSRDDFLRMTLLDIRRPEDALRLQLAVEQARLTPTSYLRSGEWQHLRKDGTSFWVDISGHAFEYQGRPSRIVMAQDVSDRRQAEDRLRLIASVFDASQEGICITDAHGRYISANPAFTRITGYTLDELIGRTPGIHHSGKHDKLFYDAMWDQLREEGRWQGEIWNRRKTGEIYPEWLTISAIKDQHGLVQQYLGICTETSARKAAEERIQHLANYDILTDLPNRSLLDDRATIALAAAGHHRANVVVMQLNLDHFRSINESLGHEAGDQVLIEMARRLVCALKQEDTVSRLGGDDFIILLPNATARDITPIALRLMSSLAEPMAMGEHEIRLTGSIGIAQFPEDGASLNQLIQAAESALQQAKREGRNTFRFFSRELQESLKETLAIERDLRFAVERNQLVLHYQPQVHIATGQIVGVEALVRWQHPERGLVSPARFIPIAEESGVIREIGEWVLNTALQQNARWMAEGLAVVPVAVNLSVVQFRHPGLRDTIQEAITHSGLPAHLVELELTESVAMEDSNFTVSTIASLKTLGVQLSVDDFGTGYSSLSYLKRFEVDKLKIDQSFVRGLHHDPQDEAIVTAVISLARSLNLTTIAEGVETEEQLAFLRQAGCDEVQGYLFSRPVPAEAFGAMLRDSAEVSQAR